MHSSTDGDAPSAAAPLDSAFSMPPDHSTAAWGREAQGRDRIDRDRYISAKREWSTESRSSYRSSGLLASGSLTASFSKRKVIGRHEAFENGRNRSTVGRSESSTSLQSPTQTGRDAGSPGYGSSPNIERSSKPLDGHHYRDARFSPASLRPLSSPHIDSRLHGNHNESEVLGAWERERSRFSSPPSGWDVANRGRDYRERSWSRPDYRRPCPLPKLDSSKEWSQSDRELLEGRIDRYSSVAGREMAFSDIACANSRESSRIDWKARDRALQSGLPTCSSADNLYNRDTKFGSLLPDAGGVVSPPQQSPLQSTFSHDSDLDAGPASKKRPRLTWGQGLAKYEKEKTGDELSAVKKLDEGSAYGLVLHFDGSVASTLPEDSLQTSDAEEIHRHVDHVRNSELQLDVITIPINIEKLPLTEAAVSGSSDSGGLVLQYMQAFINRYHKELPNLSKEILTQHVEKVEFEIDRLEKELAKLDNELDGHLIYPETSAPAIDVHSNVMPPKGALVPGSPDAPCMESPCHVDSVVVAKDSVAESDCKKILGLVDVAGSVQDPLHEADTAALGRLQTAGQSISGSYIPPQNDSPAHLESLRKFNVNDLGEAKDLAASILSSNQEIARASTAALAHLHATGVRTELHGEDFSWNRQGSVWWKQNVERHDERIQKLLESKIAEEASGRRFTEGVLAIQFRAKREAWKQEITRTLSKDIFKEKNSGSWESGSCRQLPSKLFPLAEPCAEDASDEAVEAVEKYLVDHPFDTVRDYLRMPLMVLGQKERGLHRFDSMNGLVEDPIAAELERKAMNPWSLEEKRIFLEKYSLLGKNLRKIASYLEHKTVADCVQFFYLNQKTEEFEKIHRRHQLKKRREARSSAFYLATATSAPPAVGLHLVADAAAAMSVPRSIRSLAMKSGPSGSTSSRACRDSSMVKQASAASILFAKDSSYERSCFQSPQGPPYRTLKKPHEEVLQWKSQWNDKERELFVNAVAMYGKDFDCISAYLGSKSAGQCKAYFGKARKRLGLDQLVERQREVYLNTRQQDGKLANSMKSESHLDFDLDRKMGNVPEQQPNLERSATHANPCPAPEAHGDFPRENQRFELVSAVSSPNSKAAEDIGSVVHCENAGPAVVDTQWAYLTGTNVEASCSSAKLGIAPLDTVQGCAKDKSAFGMASQIKVESKSLRSETFVASSSAVGISPSISSHGSPSPTAVSVLIPHVGESPQVKEKPIKTTESKARREPTSWTQEEKEKFVDILKVHGKDWELLRKNLPAKSLIQIKTYFQNSKAKLGLGSESSLGTSGRAGSSWKRKVDDSDSSNNTGSGSQTLPQKVHVTLDEGKLKANSNVVAAPGGPGSNVLSPDALAYANIFGRKLLEDSLNAQKVFNAMGLVSNASAPGVLPMLSSAAFSPPSLVSAQQSYIPTASASMKIPQGLGHHQLEQSSMMVMEPSSSTGVQAHQSQSQQPVAATAQDFSVPGVPLGCNKQPVQLDQPTLLQQAPPPSQQWQQVAEAVLQQLLPQAVQRHQQQLQLAGQQIPHHFQQVLSHPQVQQNWPGQSQVGSGAIPASIVSSQQMQQQTGLIPSHLHHNTHGKLHALLQQHQQPQLNQIQLLQLQRQQQQQQQQLLLHLQQAQALSQPHQMQNQALLVQQKHNFASEQQQPALLRGFAQVANANVEGFKQNDVDIRTLTMSQQAAFGNVHQLLVSNQVSESSSQLQAVSEAQPPASDVKLFGQSLLSQPLSGNQNSTAKFFSSQTQTGPAIAVTPGMITGSRLGNTASNRPWDHGFQGHGWQQSTMASAHCNGSLRSNSEGDKDVGSLSAQERVSCSMQRLNMDGPNNKDGKAVDGKVLTMSCLPDDNDISNAIARLDKGIISSVSSFSCGSSTASLNQSGSQMSGQVVNIDNNITPSMNRKDLGLVSGNTGSDGTASQGLPRVLDALVALAEWRLQNSSGGSGRLTDEFLSQSWEALQKNPGSLIEAGRASGSLSQLYSEGPQMLQHLRERLLSSHSEFGPLHSGAGGARGPDVESVRLSSNGQKLPSLALNTCGNEGGLACSDERVKMETDGSGGAHG